MQIAVLTTVHPPLDARIFYKQAISLARAGYVITLFAPLDSMAKSICNEHNIKYVPLHTASSRLDRPKRWVQLVHLLRKQQFDVWHFHDPELLPVLILTRWLLAKQVNLIYDVHEDVPKDIHDKAWIPSLLRKPLSRVVDVIEGWGIGRCQLVVAATDSIGKRVARFSSNSIVVRNFPLVSRPVLPDLKISKSKKVRIIYIGSLTEPRGILQIVQAMSYLQDVPVELLLLGEFYPAVFEKKIKMLAGDNVIIHSKVPFETVPGYLLVSDIGIVCFLPTPNHIEATPNKLFEYMQAGLPVIASNFPYWEEILQSSGCGILVDPSSPSLIAEGIRRLVDNPHERNLMGEAGRRASYEKYSWTSEARRLITAYEQFCYK